MCGNGSKAVTSDPERAPNDWVKAPNGWGNAPSDPVMDTDRSAMMLND